MKNHLTGYLMKVIYVVMSILILISPALINGYPLVYSDTGTYIASGFSGRVPFDRPLMYCLFVRHISLATSLWFVIILQAIIVWFVLWILSKTILKVKNDYLVAFCIILFLSLTTGIANYTSQIMADIFSGVMILSMAILLTTENLNKYVKLVLAVLIIFSNMAHSSNLLVATLVILSFGIVMLFFRKKGLLPLQRIVFVVSLTAGSWFLIPFLNYVSGAGFLVSRGPHIFIMGRLSESGILKQYLDEHCLTDPIALCDFKDKLPNQSWKFLWNGDSPLYSGGCVQPGGKEIECWGIKNKEFAPIVRDVFLTPQYSMQYATFIAKESWKQLGHFETEPLIPMMENSPVMINIQWRFKADYQHYITAKQAQSDFKYETINRIQVMIVPISIVALLFCLFVKKIRKQISLPVFMITVLSLAGLFFNAVVCAAFSMVADRFQGRIIWLLPLAVIMMVYSIKMKRAVISL